MMTEVFNAGDTAPLAIAAILAAGSHDLGPKGSRIEDPADWTKSRSSSGPRSMDSDKGAEGNFDD